MISASSARSVASLVFGDLRVGGGGHGPPASPRRPRLAARSTRAELLDFYAELLTRFARSSKILVIELYTNGLSDGRSNPEFELREDPR